MGIEEVLQNFGIGAAMLVVFYVFMNKVVDHFIKTIQTKDEAIKAMTVSFSETVNTHMSKHTTAIEGLNHALTENTHAMRGLSQFNGHQTSEAI